MIVYTYFEEANINRTGLLKLWEQSWRRCGWRPIVLGRDTACQYPDFDKALARFHQYPTVNNRIYETACYLRWLAMVVVGGGLMTDIDVINAGLPPQEIPGDLVFWEEDCVPSCVSGTATGFQKFVDMLLTFDGEVHKHKGRPHLSDMEIARHNHDKLECNNLCLQYKNKPNWTQYSVIHCSSHTCHINNIAREQAIQEVMSRCNI